MADWRGKYSKFLSEHPHKIGAELGVLRGQNAATMLKNLPDLELLYLVDSWANVEGPENMRICLKSIKPYMDRVEILHMKTSEGAAKVEDEFLDFVFIDAFTTSFNSY